MIHPTRLGPFLTVLSVATLGGASSQPAPAAPARAPTVLTPAPAAPAKAASTPGDEPFGPSGEPLALDLDVRDVPAGEVLRTIATRIPSARIRLEGAAKRPITLRLRAARWRDAARTVALLGHLSVREIPGGLAFKAPTDTVLVADGAPIGAWVRVLARGAGSSVVFPGGPAGLHGEVTAELRGVSYEDALEATASVHGLAVERVGDAPVLVSPGR